ncbi:MAG: hypothetical protein M3Q64_03670 [bacterium]|nr:hypothetical protein [bacterium]
MSQVVTIIEDRYIPVAPNPTLEIKVSGSFKGFNKCEDSKYSGKPKRPRIYIEHNMSNHRSSVWLPSEFLLPFIPSSLAELNAKGYKELKAMLDKIETLKFNDTVTLKVKRIDPSIAELIEIN